MVRSLLAAGPEPRLADRLRLFGRFVGDWAITSRWFRPDGFVVEGEGSVHFGWILGGTAIQDVWRGRIRNPPPGIPEEAFGTTIRIPDPSGDAWRCVWVEPLTGAVQHLVARAQGEEGILLETRTRDGRPERWIYAAIREDAFEWRAEESPDDGATWRVVQRVVARRVAPAGQARE